MEAQKMEKQGTGLSDILRILSEVPQERLLSLTFQLGKSPEEDLVHTLCLMLLRRDTQVQEQLQMLKDSSLANYLADKWHVSGGKLDAFQVQCAAHCQEESTGHGTVELARVFKVLCNLRLCDPLLRDLAYKKAISANCQKTRDRQHLEYGCLDQLREEAKLVCGPHVAEWMWNDVLRFYNELPGVLDKDKIASLKPSSVDPSDLPSPLHDSYSIDSYPTHLEISLPSTARFDRTTSATLSDPESSNATHLVEKDGPETMPAGRTASSTETLCESHQTPLVKGERDVNMDTPGSATLSAKGNMLQGDMAPNQNPQTTAPTFEPKPAPAAANKFTPEIKVPAQACGGERSTEEEEEEEEEEEDVFYSFVILHAPQDIDMAESMRERLESLGVSEGATFTADFAVPGRGTLKCIEDAINNSAYTLLLLTRNFNTRLLEVKTETALINSINKTHKYNTVIPLLPRDNCMPRESRPMVLQTFIALEEKYFERKVKKCMSSANVNKQRRLWVEEQRVRQQVRRQERLRRANEQQRLYNQELRNAKLLEQEKVRLHMEQLYIEQQHYPHLGPQFTNVPSGFMPPQIGEDGRLWSGGNIHIEHAKYIMIGNDSQMTVDLGGATCREDLTDDDC